MDKPYSSGQSCWTTEERCPRCNSSLNTNGHYVWCSFVGCTYGLNGKRETLDDTKKAEHK